MPIPGASTHLQLALRRLRQQNPRRRLRRQPAARAPIEIERQYQRELIPYLETINRVTRAELISSLPRWFAQAQMMRPPGARTDADPLADQIVMAFDRAEDLVSRSFTDDEIRRIAASKGISVSRWNKQILQRNLRRVTGVDVLWSEPWLGDTLGLFTINNTRLITSIDKDAFDAMESMVFSAIQGGTRWEDLSDEMLKYVDPSVGNIRARANLIARDQVGKLNGNLNYLRQTELGVNRYVWRTVGDERVRHSHAIKDGKIFSWDDPPSDTGHPGEDYQCRCWAEPYLEDVIDLEAS